MTHRRSWRVAVASAASLLVTSCAASSPRLPAPSAASPGPPSAHAPASAVSASVVDAATESPATRDAATAVYDDAPDAGTISPDVPVATSTAATAAAPGPAWTGLDGRRYPLAPRVADAHAPWPFVELDQRSSTVATRAGVTLGDPCRHDSDCTARHRTGVCVLVTSPGGAAHQPFARCDYDACRRDADCPANRRCVPAGYGGLTAARCVEARCTGNSDCAPTPGARCRVIARWTGSVLDLVAPELIAACVSPRDPCDVGRPCHPASAACFFYEATRATVCQEPQPVP